MVPPRLVHKEKEHYVKSFNLYRNRARLRVRGYRARGQPIRRQMEVRRREKQTNRHNRQRGRSRSEYMEIHVRNLLLTVKADGTDQPTPFGNTVAMKPGGPAKWVFTNKTNGKLVSTETWVLAADGQSMTRTSVGKREDGSALNDVYTMKRTAGDKGFEGTWESAEVKATWTNVVIEANGDAGITVTVPADSVTFPLTFDGKENPVTGPKVPPGMTTSARSAGPRKLDVTTNLNGKVLDTETWEISADDKTFTYTEHDAGEPQPTVSVFDKM